MAKLSSPLEWLIQQPRRIPSPKTDMVSSLPLAPEMEEQGDREVDVAGTKVVVINRLSKKGKR